MSDIVNFDSLSAHLWESANILRGPVDAADFKTYIFPLLFFKRLSDVYDDEVSLALEESGGDIEYAQFPENHRFQLPDGCHWKDLRAKSSNIGHALQKAMRSIEQANPESLHGIFGDAQWSHKERLSDALLKDLIEHFSSLSLSNEGCKSDVLGRAYEYLIEKFADLTNKKAGEFYTPRSVVALMVRILAPRSRNIPPAITIFAHSLKRTWMPFWGASPLSLRNLGEFFTRRGPKRTARSRSMAPHSRTSWIWWRSSRTLPSLSSF